MTFTVDTNVLVYASDQASPRHEQAQRLLGSISAGPNLCYFFWPVLLGYLRIATHPGVFADPLSPAQATDNVSRLIAPAHVQTPGEGERFWSSYLEVGRDGPLRGNLVADAHIAALMRENGISTIWTADRDFRRFEGIHPRDPFAS